MNKWWKRYQAYGKAGLVDRSSRPHHSPTRTPAVVEEQVCQKRRDSRRGPDEIAAQLNMSASTVWKILKRNGLNRLNGIDGPTGRVIGRYERDRPGDLVHLDMWAGFPQVGDGGSTGGATSKPGVRKTGPGWVTPIYT